MFTQVEQCIVKIEHNWRAPRTLLCQRSCDLSVCNSISHNQGNVSRRWAGELAHIKF